MNKKGYYAVIMLFVVLGGVVLMHNQLQKKILRT